MAKYKEGIVLHTMASSCFSVGRLCGKVQGRDCPSDNGVCMFQSTAGRASDVPGKRGLGVVSGQVQLQHSTADGATPPPPLLPLAVTVI